MDRISELFCNRKPAAIFTVAGFPDPAASEEMLVKAGETADIFILSVPFSDPMADPGDVAEASRQAAAGGIALTHVLELAGNLRKRFPEKGIVIRSYMNILYFAGYETLCGELARIGVDGILPVDLILEDRAELLDSCRRNGVHLIAVVSSLTPAERASEIVDGMTGFLYFEPVPGAEPDLQALANLKKLTPLPVVSTLPEADGIMRSCPL